MSLTSAKRSIPASMPLASAAAGALAGAHINSLLATADTDALHSAA